MPLNATQYETLVAAVDRIIPADDTPGAVKAGAVYYIVGQFERDLRGSVSNYRAGLDATNAEAIARYTVPFAQLTPGQQDALLTSLEQDIVQTPWSISARAFFLMLVNHTAEGFYSDPENGGNRHAASWEIIGF